MRAPELSIVIVAHGKRAVTERCLESLDAALGAGLGGRFELVLVDNASPDDTLALFRRWSERAVVVAHERNLNFAGGCNAGARAASGEAVLFLNNDTEVGPGAIEALAAAVREDGVGAAGCRLLYPDGTIQHGGIAMIENAAGTVLPHHLFLQEPGDLPQARAAFDLDAVTGACLAMPRDLFLELGGFDEGYANGWEDVDLCLRVRTAGRRLVYRGDIAIVHAEGQTRGADRGESANARRFDGTWGHLLGDDAEALATLFDAEFPPVPRALAGEPGPGAPVVLSGPLFSLSPAGFGARGLLAALEAAGLRPAARNRVPVIAGPRLGEGWSPVLAACERAAAPTAVRLSVGTEGGGAALPPAIPADIAPGAGGEGVLCLLPAHDSETAAALLAALAVAGAPEARVVPSVRTEAVERMVAARLPGAAVLDPCADERRLGRLAATADLVVACDPDDPFDRRALVSAAAGAPTLAIAGGETARELLGPAACPPLGDLGGALAAALAAPGDRAARSAALLARCGDRAVGERLRALVGAAQASPGSVDLRDVAPPEVPARP